MKKLIGLPVLALVCTLALPNAFAQSDIGLKAVGGEIGLISPEDVDATFSLGAFAELGTIMPQFALETLANLWWQSEGVSGLGETSARDIQLSGRVKYVFQVASNPRIHPFLGTGLGIHFFHVEVNIPDQNFGGIIVPGQQYSDSSTKLGLDIGGGLETPINDRVDFRGELWYMIVSDINQVSVKVGLAYNM